MARRRDIPRDEILDAAQHLLGTKGCHGFSLRDLGEEVGLRSASLHHHFPAKADLITAVVRRYRDRLNARIAAIEAETDSLMARLVRVSSLFSPTGGGTEMGLSGMLAAGVPCLSPAPIDEARQLTANLLGWMARFANRARSEGELPPETDAEAFAGAFLGIILGARTLEQTTPPGIAARGMELSLRKLAGF